MTTSGGSHPLGTPIRRERIDDSYQRRILANTAAERAGTPQEVAHAIAFLCSPRASYITGAVLPVSGGFGVGLYVRETPR